MQFLGGYKSNENEDEMCYKYKLHEYKHKKEQFEQKNEEEITWSMQICPNTNANGKVSDYLSNVLFVKNNDNKDRYYIDDTHFYYVSNNRNNNNNDAEIELCFNSGDYESFDEITIVTQTEYCIRHESNNHNNDFLCSRRSVSVTDICGLDSIGRNNVYFPSASIDYIPQPGQLYKLFFFIFFFLLFFTTSFF